MFLKGAFKNSPRFVQFFFLMFVFYVGLIGSSILGSFYVLLQCNLSIVQMNEVLMHIEDYPSHARVIQFISAIGSFIFPACLTAYLFADSFKNYLSIQRPKKVVSTSLLTVLSMIVVIPLLNFTQAANEQMLIPFENSEIIQWMQQQEIAMEKYTEAMLSVQSAGDLFFVVLIVAVLAALGEELFFRGALQNTLGGQVRNEHVIIWSAAIIFSAIHMQFYGFIPRMLMGAYFGYLLYYTKSIWMPILAHFTNNFLSVLLTLYLNDKPELMSELDGLGTNILKDWWILILSYSLWFFAYYLIRKNQTNPEEETK